MRMTLLTGGLCGILLAGCASSQVAKDFKYVGFEDEPTPSKAIGTVEGRDCTWSVMGYSLGAQPTVRTAFQNAADRRAGHFIPGQELEKKGAGLKSVRNVSVENDGFNAWVVGRYCVVITGGGYQ